MDATSKKTERRQTMEEREQPNNVNFFDASDDTAAADADKSSDPETETKATSIYLPSRCETGDCTAAA
jgi:hypothetical protein